MPSSKLFKCGCCEQNITKTQTSLQCFSCSLWFHISCAGFSDSDASILKSNKSFTFVCSKCSKKLKGATGDSVNNDFTEMKNLMDRFIKNVEAEQQVAKVNLQDLNTKIDKFIQKSENDHSLLKQSLSETAEGFRNDMKICLNELKADIIDANKLIAHIDTSTSNKIATLEDEIHVLHRRINRSNIVISGLPNGITDLKQIVIKIGSFLNITICKNDIQHACYINRRKLILVKFNDVELRDTLMREYFKTKSIKLSDVVEGNVDARIYINDHFGPSAGKLNGICKKLLSKKIIVRFRILNADRLKAKLCMTDGRERICNVAECLNLLDNSVM